MCFIYRAVMMHAKILLDYCAFTNNELRYHACSDSEHGVCMYTIRL